MAKSFTLHYPQFWSRVYKFNVQTHDFCIYARGGNSCSVNCIVNLHLFNRKRLKLSGICIFKIYFDLCKVFLITCTGSHNIWLVN